MACKAVLNTGLALCLVLQASAPCCCALQYDPTPEGVAIHEYRSHECPSSAPTGSPSSGCGICSVLGQVYGFPWCGDELPANGMPAAGLFELDPATEARGLAVLAACRYDMVPLCDIYAMQTLRE